MDAPTIKLGGRDYALIGRDVPAYSAYGLWDTLIAIDSCDDPLGSDSAHDGDFYPESPFDYVDALRSIRCAKERDPYPVRIDIDITQACNAACSFCFSRGYQSSEYRGARIRGEDFARILDDCAARGTKTVRLCGGGDPLLHPEATDLLPMAHERGLQLVLITNGDLITDALASGIAEHVDHLHWSVNAASDLTRRRLHRTGGSARPLSRTRECVRSIIERARGRAAKSPLMVWGTYLLVPENVREIVECTHQLRAAGLNSVSFRPVHHGLHADWTDQLTEELEAQLAGALDLSDPPIFSVFAPTRSIEEARQPSAEFAFCRSRLVRTVIEATAFGGALQSCGLKRGYISSGVPMRRGKFQFGEAWRGFLRSCELDAETKACQQCIDISMNATLEFIDEILARWPDARFVRARAMP